MAARRHESVRRHDEELPPRLDHEDSESDIERKSEDRIREDRETLAMEEEAEKLLTAEEQRRLGGVAGAFSRVGKGRSRRMDKWNSNTRGRGEVMYKVEEGSRSGRSSLESSPAASEADLQGLKELRSKTSRIVWYGRFAAIHVVIAVVFLALLYGAYRASHASGKTASPAKQTLASVRSNGTHDFAPTTILISLDGFRADFLHRGLTPTLSRFVRDGVSPQYMLPSFPSLTFPNHFTLATGLHPESHGIVGNTFWDPGMGKEFYYTDPEKSMKPEYWNAEPIWETAELQGVRSAIHMWPGSEAHIGTLEPTYVDKFNGHEPLGNKVERILGWLDLPGPNDTNASEETPRPQLIAAYVPDVDSDGHKFGPNSTYIRSTIRQADGMLGALFRGIEERNLTDIVNVVVVSDHGMATTANHRLMQLEDLVDPELIEHIDGWPLFGLRPHNTSNEQIRHIYEGILAKSQLPQFKGNLDVYLRDENMPERYHFTRNERIAPIWVVPKTGWAVVHKNEFDIAAANARGDIYSPRGLHGYDNQHPLMRAIFIARGPAFPHAKGSQVEPFQNIELYNVVCDTLGLEPRPNNGTIRLPFQTSGTHDFSAQMQIPDDPSSIGAAAPVLPQEATGVDALAEGSRTLRPEVSGAQAPPSLVEADFLAAEDDTLHRPGGDNDPSASPSVQTWKEWIEAKLDHVQVWAAGLFDGSSDEDGALHSAEEARHGENWRR